MRPSVQKKIEAAEKIEVRLASCVLRIASCVLRFASCVLRLASCVLFLLRLASCVLRLASCVNFRRASSHLVEPRGGSADLGRGGGVLAVGDFLATKIRHHHTTGSFVSCTTDRMLYGRWGIFHLNFKSFIKDISKERKSVHEMHKNAWSPKTLAQKTPPPPPPPKSVLP